MFKPKFKYSDHMIGLLTRIAAAREVILGAPLIPRWEIGKLVDLDVVRQEGQARASYYVMR